jgi:hypothetical protein
MTLYCFVFYTLNVYIKLAHACNPSFLGIRDQEDQSSRRIKVRGQPVQKVSETLLPTNKLVQWHTSIIPSLGGEEFQSEAS